MKQSKTALTQQLICTVVIAVLLLWSQLAKATEISGVITVNGTESEGIVIVAYDCDNLELLLITNTVPTEVVDGITQNHHIDVASEHVRFDLFFKDDDTDVLLTDYCPAYVVCGQIVPVDGKATVNYDMVCDVTETVGVVTESYWKSHPDEWPVDSVTVGATTYTKAQAIALMKQGDKGDKSRTIFRQLVAAKLNVAAGNDGSCVEAAIAAADAWSTLHPYNSHIAGSSSSWKQVNKANSTLESYCKGLLCAPPRFQ